MKKILSFLLALGMLFSFSMTAFADASGNMYNFNCENLNYIVEYIMDDSTVTEKITIYEKGNTPILLEKIVTSDGTITVYQNGIQTVTLTGGNYAQYVSVSQGHEPQLLTGSHNDSTSTYATYPCGYNQAHSYVSRNQYTVTILTNATAASITAALVGLLMSPVASATLSIITALSQQAIDKGADYIDVSETKYFVHGAYANDMNCYHALYTYYNLTNTGSKSVIGNKWVYTQELV